jgi:hypothetical protein
LQVEPPLAVQFADTHLPNPTRWGGTDCLGALYNPFRDTINIHCRFVLLPLEDDGDDDNYI